MRVGSADRYDGDGDDDDEDDEGRKAARTSLVAATRALGQPARALFSSSTGTRARLSPSADKNVFGLAHAPQLVARWDPAFARPKGRQSFCAIKLQGCRPGMWVSYLLS